MQLHHGEIRSLSLEQMKRVLDHGTFGHLGCYDGTEMYVIPITYAYDGEAIYLHSRVGKKVDILLNHPQVCLQVEEVDDFFNWKSVLVHGACEELDGFEASRAMHILLSKLERFEEQRRMSELETDFAAMLENSIIFRLKVDKMTGRSEGRPD